MKIGDIVYLKAYKSMVGEIKAIDDMDRVILSLCDTGLEILVAKCDVAVTESIQPHRVQESTVNILGTQYKILVIEEDDYRYNGKDSGWCDPTAKEIIVFNYKQSRESLKDLLAYQKDTIRHEIIHAFFYESGLWNSSSSSDHWAKNEEMVDWLAIQEPKLHKAFKEAGCDE